MLHICRPSQHIQSFYTSLIFPNSFQGYFSSALDYSKPLLLLNVINFIFRNEMAMSRVRCELLKPGGLLPVSLRDGLLQLCQKAARMALKSPFRYLLLSCSQRACLRKPYVYAMCHKLNLAVCWVLYGARIYPFDVHRKALLRKEIASHVL